MGRGSVLRGCSPTVREGVGSVAIRLAAPCLTVGLLPTAPRITCAACQQNLPLDGCALVRGGTRILGVDSRARRPCHSLKLGHYPSDLVLLWSSFSGINCLNSRNDTVRFWRDRLPELPRIRQGLLARPSNVSAKLGTFEVLRFSDFDMSDTIAGAFENAF